MDLDSDALTRLASHAMEERVSPEASRPRSGSERAFFAAADPASDSTIQQPEEWWDVVEPRIDCGRGVLRRPLADDVNRLTEICQDPEIQRFTRVPIPFTRSDAERFVDRANRIWEAGHPGWLLLELDGQVTAAVGVVSVDVEDGWGELGYWTAPEHRQRGLTVSAVRRLCEWCFGDAGLARLQAETAAGNVASEQLARRAGFQEEGVRRSAGVLRATAGMAEVRVDMTMWGLLPHELIHS